MSALLERYIRAVPDFPRPGILFRDITPLLNHPPAFREAVAQLAARVPEDTTHIAAVEARGFIFGAAVAVLKGSALVPIRKSGKLPAATVEENYALEYGNDTLAMHKDAVDAGAKVCLIDDLIATGGSLSAAMRLVHQCGGEVNKVVCLIELASLNGRRRLSGVSFDGLISYSD